MQGWYLYRDDSQPNYKVELWISVHHKTIGNILDGLSTQEQAARAVARAAAAGRRKEDEVGTATGGFVVPLRPAPSSIQDATGTVVKRVSAPGFCKELALVSTLCDLAEHASRGEHDKVKALQLARPSEAAWDQVTSDHRRGTLAAIKRMEASLVAESVADIADEYCRMRVILVALDILVPQFVS